MNHTPEEQLRELIRKVIREELKSREVKKDPKTGITTSNLEDKGKRVGYMKHTTNPQTGGLVAAGRIGPKAAEKEVDETTDTSSDNEEPKKDDGEEKPKRPRRRKDTRSIEQKSRDMGQIEMFEERLRETSTYKLKTNQTEAQGSMSSGKGSPVNNNMATKKGVEAAINAHRNRGSANELRKRMVHKEQKESNNEPDTSDDTPKDKPKTGEGRPDLTPYDIAAAEYYRSKGYGPGSYTGD